MRPILIIISAATLLLAVSIFALVTRTRRTIRKKNRSIFRLIRQCDHLTKELEQARMEKDITEKVIHKIITDIH